MRLTHLKRFIMPFFLTLFIMGSNPPSKAQIESFTFEDFVPATNVGLGAGARALGMGGAFIAIADDATAASWNPAGLAVLYRPQWTLVLSGSTQLDGIWSPVSEPLPAGYFSQSDIHATARGRDFNFASFAYPFYIKTTPVILQISYQRVLSFSLIQELDRPAIGTEILNSKNIHFQRQWAGRFRGGFDRVMVGFASRPFQSLLIGVTINRWLNGFTGWDQESEILSKFVDFSYSSRTTQTFTDTEDIKFRGWNAHIGVIFEVNSWLRIGAVYKTPFKGTFEKKEDLHIESLTDAGKLLIEDDTEELIADLYWPWTYGFGIGVYPSENVRISTDVTYTNWSDSRLVDRNKPSNVLTYPGQKPVDFAPQVDSIQLRAGIEWVIDAGNLLIPLRFGGILERLPQRDVFGGEKWSSGITLGIGFAINPFNIDIAYVHLAHDFPFVENQRFGDNRVYITQDSIIFSIIFQI